MRNTVETATKPQKIRPYRYAIVVERGFHIIKTFPKKEECRAFIMRNLEKTAGSEREHYVSLLLQLNHGRRSLVY